MCWYRFRKHGERSKNPPDFSVRSVGSTSPTEWHSTRRARILYMPRESGIMTGSRVAMVGRLSRFSGKRLKLQRRLYWGLNVLNPTVNQRECWLLTDASILSWEAIRRERAKWSNFELHILFYYEDNKSLRLFTSFSSSWFFWKGNKNAINKILFGKLKKKSWRVGHTPGQWNNNLWGWHLGIRIKVSRWFQCSAKVLKRLSTDR